MQLNWFLYVNTLKCAAMVTHPQHTSAFYINGRYLFHGWAFLSLQC